MNTKITRVNTNCEISPIGEEGVTTTTDSFYSFLAKVENGRYASHESSVRSHRPASGRSRPVLLCFTSADVHSHTHIAPLTRSPLGMDG